MGVFFTRHTRLSSSFALPGRSHAVLAVFLINPNFISCSFAGEIPVFPAPCGGGEHKKELGV